MNARPAVRFGNSLSTTDENWLHNLIGKSIGFTKAGFSGEFSEDFSHLAGKGLQLINFDKHISSISAMNASAISSSKYGYDAPEEEEVFADLDF